jgi:hypothetical protein
MLAKLILFLTATAATATTATENKCIQFTVAAGTGCAWMCQYCANQLGTNNYYFADGVCTYESGGCVGNPQTSTLYTCCSI